MGVLDALRTDATVTSLASDVEFATAATAQGATFWERVAGSFTPSPDDPGLFFGGSESTPITRQFDATPGGGFADETVRVASDAAQGLADAAGDAAHTARNLGPDWLDEATLVGSGLLVVGIVLWLLRPFVAAAGGRS